MNFAIGFRPKLLDALKAYTRANFQADILAGLTVGIVALPLAMAFAIASGVSPRTGIITAIIGGILVSSLGGTKVSIGGPTGAFIVILYSIYAKYGAENLAICTMMAGGILLVMGLAGFGTLIKFIPYPVTAGFTSGIAVLIFSTQIKDFCGLAVDKVPSDFIPKMETLIAHAGTFQWPTLLLAGASIGIIKLWPGKWQRRIPGSIIALILGTIAVVMFHLNPPEDGGFKYNPTNGGPADTDVTRWVQDRANELLRGNNADVKRVPHASALKAATTIAEDFVLPYVEDLKNVVDMDAIRAGGLKLGVDPLGGAALPYWEPINHLHKLDITTVNPKLDPTFSFMTVDHDGKIRMDCSSPYAMASLVALKDKFRLAFANDPDSDRHGIVTPSAGLMNPNHFLAVAVHYLFTHRSRWQAQSAVGKTLVSSSMIDRVAQKLGRRLYEVPVGFKWFAPGLFDGSVGFGGEESAGASFLRLDGAVWTTDKDGPIRDLLAAEITAVTGKDPGEHYRELTAEFGAPYYTRIDAAATPEQKSRLGKLSPEAVSESKLAGDPITAKLTQAPGNAAPIGGLKVTTSSGWFAARPSGTENIYKIYAESFRDDNHLQSIVTEAQQIVDNALTAAKR